MASPGEMGTGGGAAGGAMAGAGAGAIFGPWGAIAGAAGGALLGAFGAESSAAAKKRMYDYKAGIAAINERIAKQNAEYEGRVGEVEAQRSGMETSFKIATQKTAQAASGVDVNTGNAAALRESQREIGFQDEATIRANAARKAYGYEVAAMGASAEGKLATMAGEAAITEGHINAASSILGGVSSVSSKWADAGRYGMLGRTAST